MPAMVFLFGIPVKWAVPASLVTVAATTMASIPSHIERGTSNLRVACVLSVGAGVGGAAGAAIGELLAASAVLWVLAGATVLAAAISAAYRESPELAPPAFAGELPGAWPGTLGGSYATGGGVVPYSAERPVAGTIIAAGAALVGAIAGLGGGFINVPQMRLVMRLPLKVAAATSTFVVGVSAAAGVIGYLRAGVVMPAIAAPLLLGGMGGAFVGTWFQRRFSSEALRWLLVGLLATVGAYTAWRAAAG